MFCGREAGFPPPFDAREFGVLSPIEKRKSGLGSRGGRSLPYWGKDNQSRNRYRTISPNRRTIFLTLTAHRILVFLWGKEHTDSRAPPTSVSPIQIRMETDFPHREWSGYIRVKNRGTFGYIRVHSGYIRVHSGFSRLATPMKNRVWW